MSRKRGRQRWRIGGMSLLLVALFAFSGDARKLYVSTDGDDAPYRSGAGDQPWASLAKAASMAGPGDTVLVLAGVYRPADPQVLGCSGAPGRPIVFRSRGGRAVFDGSAVSAGSIIKVEGSYLELGGFEVKLSKDIGLNLWANPCHITIRNCVFHDNWKGAIYMGKSESTSSCRYITIEDCEAYDNSQENRAHAKDGGWPGAIQTGGVSHLVVRNCRVYRNHGEGISFTFADNCVAEGNQVYDNWSVNIYLDNATNCVVRGNLVYCTDDRSMWRYGRPAYGIQATNEGRPNPNRANRIYNNILVNNGSGFWSGNFGDDGIEGFTIANNVFYGSTEPLVVIGDRPNVDVQFVNNIFCLPAGGRLASIGSGGIRFHHNCWFGGAFPVKGEGDIYDDPGMKSPGAHMPAGYAIDASSPCRDRGVAVPGIDRDFLGGPRPVGNGWDMGAFEVGAVSDIDTAGTSGAASPPGSSGELIRNGDFAEHQAYWTFNVTAPAEAAWTATDGMVTVNVEGAGAEDWQVQLVQGEIDLREGTQYALSFRARSDSPGSLFVGASRNEDPWTQYLEGGWAEVLVGGTWQTYSYVFTMAGSSDDNARVEFNRGTVTGIWQLDDVSLRRVSDPSRSTIRPPRPSVSPARGRRTVDLQGRTGGGEGSRAARRILATESGRLLSARE